jgi:hypothetical protein
VFALFDHDGARFFIGIFVLVHGVVNVHPIEVVLLQVVGKEEDEGQVIDELLEPLEGELVKVVVDLDDLGHLFLVLHVDSHDFFWIYQSS